jgi:protein EPIDERMAL PATTERNING FACTOR 1/2
MTTQVFLIHRTSNHADASGGSADTARLDGSVAADRGTNNKPHQATTMMHDSKPPAEDELLLATMARQRAASGSRLPDCLHACGACSPCRRVIVSFKCAESASESCPMAYRCMCRGRFFRVPYL